MHQPYAQPMGLGMAMTAIGASDRVECQNGGTIDAGLATFGPHWLAAPSYPGWNNTVNGIGDLKRGSAAPQESMRSTQVTLMSRRAGR